MYNNTTSFISERDERTDAILEQKYHKHAKILLVLGDKTAESFVGQVMSVSIANLLSRSFNKLSVISPDVILDKSLSLFGQISLKDEITSIFKSNNPKVELIANSEKADLVIGVGIDSKKSIKMSPDVIIDGDGWFCAMNPRNDIFDHSSENVCGPVFAACIGMSELLKKCEGKNSNLLIQERLISLLDFQIDNRETIKKQNEIYPSFPELGKILMVGGGAVGSSVVYLLRMLNCSFSLDIVDHDFITTGNLSKSPLFFFKHAEDHNFKASILAQWLQNVGDRKVSQGYSMRYSEFSIKYLSNRQPNQYDIILPLADIADNGESSENARVQIQQGYFPIMIHGTTTPDWGINLHRHIPFTDDCILCRLPTKKYNVKFACGEEVSGEDKIGSREHRALPFQPLMAAVLVVSELIKLSLSGYPFSENKVYIDCKGAIDFIIQSKQVPTPSCDCRNKVMAIHKKWNGQSKYDQLVTIVKN